MMNFNIKWKYISASKIKVYFINYISFYLNQICFLIKIYLLDIIYKENHCILVDMKEKIRVCKFVVMIVLVMINLILKDVDNKTFFIRIFHIYSMLIYFI